MKVNLPQHVSLRRAISNAKLSLNKEQHKTLEALLKACGKCSELNSNGKVYVIGSIDKPRLYVTYHVEYMLQALDALPGGVGEFLNAAANLDLNGVLRVKAGSTRQQIYAAFLLLEPREIYAHDVYHAIKWVFEHSFETDAEYEPLLNSAGTEIMDENEFYHLGPINLCKAIAQSYERKCRAEVFEPQKKSKRVKHGSK